MQAKDTVMSKDNLGKAFDGDFGEVSFDHQPTPEDIFLIKLELVAKAQAEISFKAGMEYALTKEGVKESLDSICRRERQGGRREVVEFIDDLIIGIDNCKFEERLNGDKGCIVLDMNENQWQAFKKERGL